MFWTHKIWTNFSLQLCNWLKVNWIETNWKELRWTNGTLSQVLWQEISNKFSPPATYIPATYLQSRKSLTCPQLVHYLKHPKNSIKHPIYSVKHSISCIIDPIKSKKINKFFENIQYSAATWNLYFFCTPKHFDKNCSANKIVLQQNSMNHHWRLLSISEGVCRTYETILQWNMH